MTTDQTSEAKSEVTKESALIQTILKGDEENAVKLASELSRDKHESNDVIDTISEAMNIATDLHEVEKYSEEQVEKSEKAAESALEAVKGKIRVEQKRIHGRVMVASLAADPHSFECTLMLTMLKACGFTPVDGGSELTPKQLTANPHTSRSRRVARNRVIDNSWKTASRHSCLWKGSSQSLDRRGTPLNPTRLLRSNEQSNRAPHCPRVKS
jgi:hypothetical protein